MNLGYQARTWSSYGFVCRVDLRAQRPHIEMFCSRYGEVRENSPACQPLVVFVIRGRENGRDLSCFADSSPPRAFHARSAFLEASSRYSPEYARLLLLSEPQPRGCTTIAAG